MEYRDREAGVRERDGPLSLEVMACRRVGRSYSQGSASLPTTLPVHYGCSLTADGHGVKTFFSWRKMVAEVEQGQGMNEGRTVESVRWYVALRPSKHDGMGNVPRSGEKRSWARNSILGDIRRNRGILPP